MIKIDNILVNNINVPQQASASFEINAPCYWWREFNAYNNTSTINLCAEQYQFAHNELTVADFSTDHIDNIAIGTFNSYIDYINNLLQIWHEGFMQYEKYDKRILDSVLQMLPASYNQTCAVTISYDDLRTIYLNYKNCRQQEWIDFCTMIATLPNAEELICK